MELNPGDIQTTALIPVVNAERNMGEMRETVPVRNGKESKTKQTKPMCDAVKPTPAERQLAEDTFSFCMEHMQEHFTIPFLAARAGISPTRLKQIYRRVYGASLFAHIRKEKMHWATQELALTNMRVIDIAETCGYDNASKFSAAFCDIMGCTPTAYRSCVRSE